MTPRVCRSIGAMVMLGSSSMAWAFQPSLVSIKPESDGTFTYSFRIKIDSLAELRCGHEAPDPDFFTIFNFDGLVSGSEKQPAGWTFATSTHGVTPIRGGRAILDPVDTPGIPNLTWSCTGLALKGPLTIEGFSIRTKVKDTMVGEYGTQQTRVEAGTIGTRTLREVKEASIGAITVPFLKA